MKLTRSAATFHLLRRSPNAFALLSLIALRTQRQPSGRFLPGQSPVGDHAECGLTRRQYRTALAILVTGGYVTARGTKRGTIATLTPKGRDVFDVNLSGQGRDGGGHQKVEKAAISEHAKSPMIAGTSEVPPVPSGHQESEKAATQKKEELQEGERERESRQRELHPEQPEPPTLEAVVTLAASLRDPRDRARDFHEECAALGWQVRNAATGCLEPIRDWRQWYLGWRKRKFARARTPARLSGVRPVGNFTGPGVAGGSL